jgi:phosphomannomutase
VERSAMSIFKAYDIRGVYPTELNEKIMYKIGRAFVDFLKCKNVVVGRDMRLSSPSLFNALVKGIIDQGADVIDIGLSTTPMLYYAVHELKADSGLVITASHNPKEWNGLKLVREEGRALSGEDGIKEIEEKVKNNDFKDADEQGKITQKNITHDYINYAASYATNLNNFKIVVDCGNGMAGLTLIPLIEKLGIEYTALYSELDGSFPNHEPDPLKEKNMKDLQEKVVELKADVGFALDGDVDRIILVDEKGNRIPGDITTALIAKDLLSKKKIKVMYDIRASKSVKELIEKNGGTAMVYRAGHSLIKKKMREEGFDFGGEKSGHYFYKQNFYTDSALITLIYILELLKKEGKKLSELVKDINPYSSSGEINRKVKDKDEVLKRVEEKYKDALRIFHIDGVTIEYKDWWFNLRKSNTEPLLRLNLEADNKGLMKEKIKEVLGLIER